MASSVEETQEQPKVGKKKQLTVSEYDNRFDDILKDLNEILTEKKKQSEKGTREIGRVIKQIEKMKKDLPAVIKLSKKKKTGAKTGATPAFGRKSAISEPLRKFLNVPKGTMMTRAEVTSALTVYISWKDDETRENKLCWKHLNPNKRNLQDPENRSKIILDDTLTKLLNYKQYQADVKAGKVTATKTNKRTGEKEEYVVTDDTVKYPTLQRLIGHLFV